MNDQRYEPRRQRRRWQNSQGPRMPAASLVLIGLILGFAGALYYAWVIQPVSFTEASPARMSAHYRSEYILLVGQSYEADGNWGRASDRLAALKDPDVAQTVGALLEEFLRRGEPAPALQSLAILAGQLGVENAAVAVFAPQPSATAVSLPAAAIDNTATPQANSTQSPTRTPFPTATPTAVPSPTPVPVFRLLKQEQVCSPREPIRRVEVVAVDSTLEPLPGAEVIVQWDEGADHFFTGYQPERGLGYGDFEMDPEVAYEVMMAEGSLLVKGLRIVPCTAVEGGLEGGWRLTFQNSDVIQDSTTP